MPSVDDFKLKLHMKRQYSNKKQKNKKRGQRTSMFFAQLKLFHLLSVNTGIAEWASQWLRGVCSFNWDFQRLPKVCRRSNEASRFFSSELIFNSHWLKLARKSWWSAQAFDFISQVYVDGTIFVLRLGGQPLWMFHPRIWMLLCCGCTGC